MTRKTQTPPYAASLPLHTPLTHSVDQFTLDLLWRNSTPAPTLLLRGERFTIIAQHSSKKETINAIYHSGKDSWVTL